MPHFDTAEPQTVPEALLSFYCPLVAEVSPEADLLQERTLAWATRFDLAAGDPHRTAMWAQTGAAMTAFLLPHATGAVAEAFACYNAWAFGANDYIESTRPIADTIEVLGRWERTMRAPNSWPNSTTSMDLAQQDALLRIQEHLTPVQWERFIAGQSHWLCGMMWEVALRARDAPLSLNEYLASRLTCAGGTAAASYLDAVEGIELSEQEWAHPAVRAAAEVGMLAAALDNDRYSCLKELLQPVRKPNLFDAIRRERPNYSRDQVVTEGVALRDSFMTLYLRLRAQLLASAGEDLRRYLSGLDCFISGNLAYATAAARRYSPPGVVLTITQVDQPSDGNTAPVDIPTVASWWDQLDRPPGDGRGTGYAS
ncbi:hypothetical protein C8D88_12610 [Lentzea atacamensis]|uniref:Terpene synthase n=1 Tax=Lentzea atacamensis TaxID=531938 RepID=A0A316HDK2_9PSEU|nr:hypothetical protein [Lentzea atacamensis]PWK78618.1 hypothetical protein C8D88_12610 [Lentzea atacamensis]